MRRTTRWLTLVAAAAALAGGCGDDFGAAYDPSAYPPGPPSNGAARYDEAPPGDRYEAVGTNPFTRTDHDPFSTFAADVDTASYDIFVRDASDGMLPAPDSVRLEEYVNFFPYDYEAPEPGADVPFAIHLAAAQHPMGRQLAQLRVGIQAEAPPPSEKRPTNLVFLVDTSGSMHAGDKLPLVKRVLTGALAALDPDDTISIVTYAGSVGVALRPTPVSRADEIAAVIESFEAGGGTSGASGIRLAYDQAEAGFIEGGINHIVLCTDGDFNIGISDTDALVELIEEERAGGVTLTALGFGRGNLNDAMMERVSNAGNGIYSVITSAAHADRYAERAILNTLVHVAKDMKIQVEFNPEHVVAYRLLGYENRAIADDDFRVDTVDAGEVGAGHRVTALYELVLVGQSIPDVPGAPAIAEGEPTADPREIDPAELVRVKVRWKDVGASEADAAHETTASLTPADVSDDLYAAADEDFLWAAAIAAFAEILKGNAYGDPADLDYIGTIVEAQRDRDEDRAAFADLFATVRGLVPAPTPAP